MMLEVKNALQILMVPDDKIHIEYFTAKEDEEKIAADVGAVSGEEMNESEISGATKVKISYDGAEHEFEMDSQSTILESALDAGLDPPYSCMVAACCTCRAKLLSGRVEMEDREALTDEEIDQGYVLTCQSHPKTHGVVLDYDA